MAINFKVFSLFGAKDAGVDKNFDKMSKSAKKFGKTSEKAFKRANKSAVSFKTVMGGILAAGGVQKGISMLGTGVATVTEEFLGFDNAVTAASAKFKGLDLTTKEGQKTLEDLRKTARKVGAETEFNAKQAAEGLDFLALASFNAEQAMALLPGVTNLATVAQVDLGTATDIASDSLGAFGLMTKDTEQLTANFTRVQDVMAKTTATSNTSLIDLFEAVKKGAPAFTAAGQSLESFNALAGIMANAGVKGSESGTQLRNVMLRLSKPTKESADTLKKLGVEVADEQGNFRDIIDIMSDMEKGLEGMGSQQRSAALATIFGSRAVTGVNILLKEGTESIRTYRSELENAGGSAEKMAEIMRGSLTNQLESLKSAAIEVGFQLLDAFSGEGAGAIKGLTQFVRGIDMTPVIEGLSFVIEKGKMVFETLSQAGVFDLLQASFGALISVIQLLWSIAEPIFKLMWKILEPIVKGLTFVAKGIGFLSKSLATEKPAGAEKVAAPDLAMVKFGQQGPPLEQKEKPKPNAVPNLSLARFGMQAPQAPQRQAPNQTQTQLNLTRVDFRGQIDIAGAPEGSKAESSNSQVDMNMMGNPKKAA